ncbi:MAG: hypothetical protein ACRD38_04770 [Nitrososphaerales archaeon]
MGQSSYVLLLIVLTVVMAATLVVFAIAFDTYVGSDDVFANLELQGTTSDIVEAKMPAFL